MEDKILEELTCPITLELFDDPITVPCCGKSFSRNALHACLINGTDKRCPLCTGDLTTFDALAVQTNRNLLSFVELMKNQQLVKQQLARREEQKEQQQQQAQQWSLTINKIYSDMKFVCSCGYYFMCYENREAHIANASTGVHKANGEYKINKNNNDGEVYIPIAEFRLNLCHSAFQLTESLFIIVVDKSGSMSGNPWKQVQTALIHILGITKPNKLIKTEIVTYASTAQLLANPNTDKIKSMRAGGGTNFNRAFTKINEIIYRYTHRDDCNINNITICFLTDGQDTSGPTNKQLVASFRRMIAKYDEASVSLVVHSIGFSQGCDKAFLEELRTENGGTFRYAEPGDKDDELCNKLKSLFQQISRCSNIMIDIKIESKLFSFYQAKNVQSKEITIAFPVNNNKEGAYAQWVVLHDDEDEKEEKDNDGYIVINSTIDKHVKIPVMMNVVHQNRKQKMFDQWITSLIDEIATCIYNLANKQFGYDDELVDIFDLHCALVQQKLDILQVSTKNKSLQEKIEYLAKEIGKLRDGLSINMGHISDQRFGSKFANLKYGDRLRANELEHKQSTSREQKAAVADIEDEILIRYAFNHDGKNRNDLQKCIMTLNDVESISIIKRSTDIEKDLLHKDADGNNALLLACYCGRFEVVTVLLDIYCKMKQFDINLCTNNDGETAITLAIKKRGYWRTIKVLLENNAVIALNRSEALEKYAIANQYVITAKLIRDQKESSTKINESMSEQYIQHLFKKAIEINEKEIDFEEYLVVCLKKKMIKMVTLLVDKYKTKSSIDMLLNYCIPATHNAPNVDQYLSLAKVILEHNPQLITQTNENGETALYKACESGNLALVQYFLQLNKELVNVANINGNTPLYIACVKLTLCRFSSECYPCIMKELITQKADVNYINNEGQSPIYPVTDRGNPNFAEILLSTSKIKLDIINKKGDSIVIHCCRLGHSKILELLLNHIEDKSFVCEYESTLNGFNALLSCVDAARFTITDQTNHEECIKMLADFGVDLNIKAAKDNIVIAGGSALHLAAFYDEKSSLDCLLSLGANVNEIDCEGQIPLHIAVINNHLSIIKMLRNANSNIFQKDFNGQTPLSYCQQNNEIKKVLMNPLLVPLMRLAKGLFKDECLASNVLKSYIGIIGLLPNEKCVNITDFDGNYPLLSAIIYGQQNIVQLLLELGANPYLSNAFGVNSFVFANWIKNHKIKHLFSSSFDIKQHDKKQLNEAINNLKQSCEENNFNSYVLHLSKVPKDVNALKPLGIINRMKQYIDKSFDANDANKYVKNIMYKIMNTESEEEKEEYDESCIERAFGEKDSKCYLDCLWHSKLYTINMIASGKYAANLQAFHIFFINMYGNNKTLSKTINRNIMNHKYSKCIQLCCDSFSKLPNYNGKTYIGAHDIVMDRSKFLIGATFCWKTYVSSTGLIKNMNTGTILMIESKTGKNIAPYSSFAESEIIILPLTKFVVQNWFKCQNVAIATQQSEQMELLTNNQIKQYMKSQQDLIIIQLKEI